MESSYLVTFFKHSLRTFRQKNDRIRSGQVTGGSLLKPPQKSLQSRQSQSFARIDFFSSGFHKGTTMPCTICISQNLYICELRSGQIHDLYITSLWENTEMRPTSSKWVETTQFFHNYDGLSYLWWSRFHLWAGTPGKVISGHGGHQ